MWGYVKQKLSGNLFTSRLCRTEAHGAASTITINGIFCVFFFIWIIAVVCAFLSSDSSYFRHFLIFFSIDSNVHLWDVRIHFIEAIVNVFMNRLYEMDTRGAVSTITINVFFFIIFWLYQTVCTTAIGWFFYVFLITLPQTCHLLGR